MKKYFLAGVLLSSSVIADQWQFPPERTVETFNVNGLTIEKVVDTTENQIYPDYYTNIYRGDVEVASYKNLTFQYLKAFNDGKFIFAGTNSGLSRFAHFVLDSEGGLVIAKAHHSDGIEYCGTTVSLVREWLPDNDVEIVETYQTESIESFDGEIDEYTYLESAAIKMCNGNLYELW